MHHSPECCHVRGANWNIKNGGNCAKKHRARFPPFFIYSLWPICKNSFPLFIEKCFEFSCFGQFSHVYSIFYPFLTSKLCSPSISDNLVSPALESYLKYMPFNIAKTHISFSNLQFTFPFSEKREARKQCLDLLLANGGYYFPFYTQKIILLNWIRVFRVASRFPSVLLTVIFDFMGLALWLTKEPNSELSLSPPPPPSHLFCFSPIYRMNNTDKMPAVGGVNKKEWEMVGGYTSRVLIPFTFRWKHFRILYKLDFEGIKKDGIKTIYFGFKKMYGQSFLVKFGSFFFSFFPFKKSIKKRLGGSNKWKKGEKEKREKRKMSRDIWSKRRVGSLLHL